MRSIFLLLAMGVAALTTPAAGAAAQVPTDTSVTAARRAFDFLVGRWEVVSLQDTAGVVSSSGEIYEFEKALSGALLSARWHFNRGTRDRADFVDAAYFQAYDNSLRIWTFYYVSPQSAQYWPGQLQDGRWYFTRSFTDGGRTWQQRQWWEPVGTDTLRRHIENSPDGGKTWIPFVYTLRRR